MNLPYVYRLTHKETNQFYIGYRAANKVRSFEDLGFKYFSSSKQIEKLGFENFNIEILAEFIDSKHAYEFEQLFIKENFKDPLCLNKSCFHDKKDFICLGHSPETKKKLKKLQSGRKHSPETKEKISKKMKGENNPNFGKNFSKDTRRKMSLAQKIFSFQEELMIFSMFKSGYTRKEICINRCNYNVIVTIIRKFNSIFKETGLNTHL